MDELNAFSCLPQFGANGAFIFFRTLHGEQKAFFGTATWSKQGDPGEDPQADGQSGWSGAGLRSGLPSRLAA